jgi:hypothetical protein
MFAAQVIDEENESQHNETKDQSDPNPTDNDRENPRSDEVDNNNIRKDPIGSQYDSEQEGDPLDDYEEYIEVEDYSNDNGDVIYIRAGRVGSIDPEVEDDFDNIGNISKVLTLLGSADLSMRLMDINREMTPHEVLTSLSEDIWKEIWKQQMCEEELNWTFPTFPIVIEDDELGINIPKELMSMGYTSHESIKDAEWLQHLSSHDL